MQDKYVGDVGDFGKYGLLNHIYSVTGKKSSFISIGTKTPVKKKTMMENILIFWKKIEKTEKNIKNVFLNCVGN